ncbi:alpha/beta fold hydrolase [Streptacidiphilus rugosus]|uniref:alpha/beta fold hydrolase n=1 Tax=Streptacidiphilus rugosus TaxID=405783 RepID=UPI000A665A19|nr:alpha/beta hydrolase [Streptacidiphilus rugosus]
MSTTQAEEPTAIALTYTGEDGAELGYLSRGTGAPLVCLPGGPGADVRYLGGLGGLDAHRALILPDQRATGRSPVPQDRARCAYTAQARDLEALREHLGVEELDLLGHSAAALTAQEYAAAFPGRVRRLVLVTPVGRVSREADEAELAEIKAGRAGEPWYEAAVAAEAELAAGGVPADRIDELTLRTVPFVWGRWTESARALYRQPMDNAPDWYRAAFYAGGPGAEATEDERSARLARLAASDAQPLVLAGGQDGLIGVAPARLVADLHPGSRLVVFADGGHRLWHEEPERFVDTVLAYLDA